MGGETEWARDVEGGCRLVVWVVPGASRSEIAGVHGNALKVRVAAPAEGGRATAAVERLLSGRLGVPVALLSGASARRKTYLVPGLGSADVVPRLLPGPW